MLQANLRWSRLDDSKRAFLLARAERGLPTPEVDALADPPASLQRVWDGFFDLDSERPIGFGGAGRIPWSAEEAWLDAEGVGDPDERGFYRALWRQMDGAYLAEVNPKREDAEAKRAKTTRKGA